jgi:hypothetical protein
MKTEIDQISTRIDAAVRMRNARFGDAASGPVRPSPSENPEEAIDRHSLAALDRVVAKREANLAQKPTIPPTSTRQSVSPSLPTETMSHPHPSNSGLARDGNANQSLATMEWAVAKLKQEKLGWKGNLPALSTTWAPQSDMASLTSQMIEAEVLWKLTMKVRQALPNEQEEAIRNKAWKMFEQLRRERP